MAIETVWNIGSIRFSNLTFSFFLSEKHWATAPLTTAPLGGEVGVIHPEMNQIEEDEFLIARSLYLTLNLTSTYLLSDKAKATNLH